MLHVISVAVQVMNLSVQLLLELLNCKKKKKSNKSACDGEIATFSGSVLSLVLSKSGMI